MIQRLRIRALIKHKGGASQVAALCGVAQPNVSTWSSSNSIPAKYALLLGALWDIDPDLLHNPWPSDKRMFVNDAQQAAIIAGDYDLRLDAPRAAWRGDVPLYDPNEPIVFEPFKPGEGWDDDED